MTDDVKDNQMPPVETKTAADTPRKNPHKSPVSIIFRALLCVIIITAGYMGAIYLTQSKPKANRHPPDKITHLVRVQTVTPKNQTIIVKATGTVIPAQKITLKSRVTGEVIQTHPEFSQGGILKKGSLVLKVDDADYQLALDRKQTEAVNARYAIALEEGRQEVARREWALINKDEPAGGTDAELALRKPHLEKVQADLKSAQAGIEQAQLNLQRTKVHAPFNAIIREKYVEIGSQLAPHERVAELVGTDEFWVRVAIPVDRLKWISIPAKRKETGSTARIVYRSDIALTGSVFKLLGDLEPEGRMARLLITVKDPLSLNSPDTQRLPLLIGEYVRVEIQASQMDNVYRIPRTALRNNTHLWIAGKDGKLEIRPVETIWRDTEAVFVKTGLKPGEQLIVSDLSAPIAGMPLRVERTE